MKRYRVNPQASVTIGPHLGSLATVRVPAAGTAADDAFADTDGLEPLSGPPPVSAPHAAATMMTAVVGAAVVRRQVVMPIISLCALPVNARVNGFYGESVDPVQPVRRSGGAGKPQPWRASTTWPSADGPRTDGVLDEMAVAPTVTG